MSEPSGPAMPTLLSSEAILARAAEQLADTYRGVFSRETILRYLDESYQLLAATARITTHLPNLAIRFATERLAAVARNEGAVITGIPEVLFVCVHNAGRSQMAAALLDHHAAGRIHVRSAGSTPASEINPAVIAALDEVGIDMTKEFPKPLTDEVVRASDVVVLMGCGDACPVYPGKRYLDWDLPDPAGLPIGQVRPIRDEIDTRVRALLHELTGQETVTMTTNGKPSVLFVCVHNAGRSQMAAGFLRHLAGDAIEVRSAGSAPAEQINPVAVEAMEEIGIDITGQKPKVLTPEDSQASTVVITMGCGDVCPYYPGQHHEDWDIPDPAGQDLDTVRTIRDDIGQRVRALVNDLSRQSRR